MIAVAVFLAVIFAYRSWSETSPAKLAPARAGLPRIVLWAWERPERLEFIDPRETGVAFLARTLFLRGSEVVVRPRLQPLQVAPGTSLIAVARIESDRAAPPELSAAQALQAARAIRDLAFKPGVIAIQIDFDAARSERAFYRALVSELRRELPAAVGLTITALASWCLDDDWIADLPVDEAVPMLFRMGADDRHIRLRLKARDDFRPRICRESLGVATDEPVTGLPAGRRVYLFHPRAWSADSFQQSIKEVRTWL